ncbi:MAG TPA: retropepsin-like aspartic protease, partial [Candidatus Dojkabacteria bacterium]|nr:retropepsin-like aspartic protease [Candidatus Dojkabacteria bacterium]
PILAFTTRFNGHSNILYNQITILPPEDFPSIKFEPVKITAIWDTGATHTCITEKLAKQLGLIPTTKRETQTAGGSEISDVYIVDIGLPNRYKIKSVQVGAVKIHDGIDALIGMDIIGAGDFSVSNVDGITIFSFRMPSLKEVDYVEIGKRSLQKISSNETKKSKKKRRKQAKNSRKQNRKKRK